MKKELFKRKKSKIFSSGRNIILGTVSILLALTAGITTTISWIEDVSQVEFNSNDDSQRTPVHIGGKLLSADAEMKNNPVKEEVNLADYFNKSGDMHLSPCYGDGENFYFPIDGGTQNPSGFRVGTKDDANVNYLSATFRVKSAGANTVYWFEKDKKEVSGASTDVPYISFKDGGSTGTAVTGLEQYLRCSITVDGATTVYALNSDGKFVADDPQHPKSGRIMDNYTYYDEGFDDSTKRSLASNSSLLNQGAGTNLNGNTLFSVNQYDSTNKNSAKTVTVKIWLEYNNTTKSTAADISSVNIKLVSSWAKMRRVYVIDRTVDEYDAGIQHTGARWLKNGDGSSNGRLFWSVNDGATHFEAMTKVGEFTDTDGSGEKYDLYYIDIPAVYNNVKTTLYRCKGTWNNGSQTDSNNVTYWDKWETTFPDTFHSETFTVYSHKYATWDTQKAKKVFFVDSAKFADLGLTPKVYLWDHNSVYDSSDVNGKVVKNADWPGLEMTRLYETSGNLNLNTYCLFFGSEYDRAVFNDGVSGARNQLQSQDVYLKSGNSNWYGKFFDMATLGWYNNKNSLPTYSNCVLVNNFNTNNSTQAQIRLVQVAGNNNHWLKCRAYLKSRGDNGTSSYFFKIYDGNTHWGRPQGWSAWAAGWEDGEQSFLRDIGNDTNAEGDLILIQVTDNDLATKGNQNGVITLFFDKDSHYFKWDFGEL